MILVILKIIGILLLALVILFLLLLGSLLFVPVRYKLAFKKNEKDFAGRAFVSWLLHLVSFSCEYAYGWEKPRIEIRILGISMKRLLGKGRNKKEPSEKSFHETTQEGEDISWEEPVGEEAEREASSWEEPTGEETEREASSWEEPMREEAEKEASSWEEPMREEAEKEASSWEEPLEEAEDEPEEPSMRGREENSEGEQSPGGEGKLHGFLEKLRKLRDLPAKLIRKWKRKLRSFLNLFQEYEAGKTAGILWTHIKYLARHYGIRRIKGYMRFGTGDPASTGELTGILYLFLPAGADKFTLSPDFHEAVLEADLEASGHIRFVHLLIIAIKIFRDKNMKKILRRLRSR